MEQTSTGGTTLYTLVGLIVSLLIVASAWIIYAKAKRPGWAAIVPIYNTIIWLKIINKPVWWIFILLVPIVNIVILFIMFIELGKAFGKDALWSIFLLILFPIIGYPILAFGKAQYQGSQETSVRSVTAPIQQPIANQTMNTEPQVFPEALAQTDDSMTIDKVSEPIEHSQVELAIEEMSAPMDGITIDSVSPAPTTAPVAEDDIAPNYGRQYQSEAPIAQAEPVEAQIEENQAPSALEEIQAPAMQEESMATQEVPVQDENVLIENNTIVVDQDQADQPQTDQAPTIDNTMNPAPDQSSTTPANQAQTDPNQTNVNL